MNDTITPSSGNVFADLGFASEEVAIYTMRAQLMARIRETVKEREWTQTEAAEHLRITQSRVPDLMRGKHDKFSLDMLVALASRLGRTVELEVV